MFEPEEKHEIQISWLNAKCICGVESTGQGAGPGYLVPDLTVPTERTLDLNPSPTGPEP